LKGGPVPAFFYTMINLKQGNNDLFVSLNERIKLDSPFIILMLQDTQSTPDIKLMLVADISDPSDRLNNIQLELVATEGAEDLANGKVFLYPGDYYYQIYESADDVLDITGKHRLERGLAKYDIDTNTDQNYNDTPDEKIYRG
jgi:hypothetical protein